MMLRRCESRVCNPFFIINHAPLTTNTKYTQTTVIHFAVCIGIIKIKFIVCHVILCHCNQRDSICNTIAKIFFD